MRRRSTRNWLTGAFLGIAACAGSGILHAQASPSQHQPPTRCGGTRLETQPGATLSELLAAYASSQCPLNALMWETYTANPHAFYGSIHHLRADTILSVPAFSAPDGTTREVVDREIAGQREIYERYRSLIAQGVSRQRARRLSVVADPSQREALAQGANRAQRPSNARQAANPSGPAAEGARLKLDPLDAGSGDRGAGTPEQAVMRTLALREAEARIRILEQQISDLKGLLAERDQLLAAQTSGASDAQPGMRQGAPASAEPGGSASAKRPDAPPEETRRERPAMLQTTEGTILAALLLLALATGIVLLWQMRRPASALPLAPDPQWPAELRAARDAINRAAGRDAETERPSELEKAVGGRFPLPQLDFVEGLGGRGPAQSGPESGPRSPPGPG